MSVIRDGELYLPIDLIKQLRVVSEIEAEVGAESLATRILTQYLADTYGAENIQRADAKLRRDRAASLEQVRADLATVKQSSEPTKG